MGKFVSWSCITYGREWSLPNLVKQFQAQDYKGKKELVILNDDPDVRYISDHPEIKIYNWDYRFENIREKHNICKGLCDGEILIPVDDDDLYKPWTTTMFVNEIGESPFVACNGFWKDSQWHQSTVAGLYACTAEFFKQMGGYAKWMVQYRKWEPEYDWVVHPQDFLLRVKDLDKCYKEFKVDAKTAFYTWTRTGDRSGWDTNNLDKYINKERTPKTIKIG